MAGNKPTRMDAHRRALRTTHRLSVATRRQHGRKFYQLSSVCRWSTPSELTENQDRALTGAHSFYAMWDRDRAWRSFRSRPDQIRSSSKVCKTTTSHHCAIEIPPDGLGKGKRRASRPGSKVAASRSQNDPTRFIFATPTVRYRTDGKPRSRMREPKKNGTRVISIWLAREKATI